MNKFISLMKEQVGGREFTKKISLMDNLQKRLTADDSPQ